MHTDKTNGNREGLEGHEGHDHKGSEGTEKMKPLMNADGR
jgi:hypothetical protein